MKQLLYQPTITMNVINPCALRPEQNGQHFADNIFKYIFFEENVDIVIEISLKCVPVGPVDTQHCFR